MWLQPQATGSAPVASNRLPSAYCLRCGLCHTAGPLLPPLACLPHLARARQRTTYPARPATNGSPSPARIKIKEQTQSRSRRNDLLPMLRVLRLPGHERRRPCPSLATEAPVARAYKNRGTNPIPFPPPDPSTPRHLLSSPAATATAPARTMQPQPHEVPHCGPLPADDNATIARHRDPLGRVPSAVGVPAMVLYGQDPADTRPQSA